MTTGGEAVVEALRVLGVTKVFGIVSVHNVPTLDAIGRSDSIDFICCRHEQGAVHAADGYARATGTLGVALTSTGPGAANAMGGLFEANYASIPVLMITGQVDSSEYGRGRGTIHQAENQLTMLRTVTKRAEHIEHADDIAATILSIAGDMLSGRQGPGAVEIPINLQYAPAEVGDLTSPRHRISAPPAGAIRTAADVLTRARRPLIIAGGGVIAAGASRQLTALAERLEAPVFTTIEGRGAISERHRLALGPNLDLSAMDPIPAAADVVLAVGTRFQQNTNVLGWLRFPGSLVHVDVDPTVIGRVHTADHPIVGDARLSLEALLELVVDHRVDEESWVQTCRAIRDGVVATSYADLGADLVAIMETIDEVLPDDCVVAKDATISSYLWANRWLPVVEPRTAMRPAGQAIGPGVSLGIGAAVGSGKPTVVVQGDGGLMLSVGELATAVQYDLPLIVCVFNDRGYGMLKVIQEMAVGGRYTGVDLATPDFAAMGTSFGMRSAAVSSAKEFDAAFRQALDTGGPWILDIDLTKMERMKLTPQPWPVRASSTPGRSGRRGGPPSATRPSPAHPGGGVWPSRSRCTRPRRRSRCLRACV